MRRVLKTLPLLLAALAVVSISVHSAHAQDKGGDDLRAKAQNPVASMYSLPFKNTLDFGADDGEVYMLSVQPVIPITIGSLNYINRIILPIIDVPGSVPLNPESPSPEKGDGAFGLGDINYSLFVSPVDSGKVTWAFGPSVTFPTATNQQLGTDKWSAGPTFIILTQPKPWTVGALFRQLWSFAGDDDRSDVNQFLFEPFVNFNLQKGWYLISDMVLTANWDAPSGQQWTVPLGGGVGKLFAIGKQPINCRMEAYYNVKRPDRAPNWSTSFTIQFLFPR